MAAKTNALKVVRLSDLDVQLTRDFDAPVSRVWEAMTKPEYVRQWWGRVGSTLPVCDIDFRPGGSWRFVERSADGSEHPFKGEFREIVPMEKVVQTFIYDVPPFDEFVAEETMTLTDRGGRTTVTTISRGNSKEGVDSYLQSGMEEGAGETYDRLEELLAKMA